MNKQVCGLVTKISILPVLLVMPTFADASNISGISYETLADAMTAAETQNGVTVTLWQDMPNGVGKSVASNSAFTVDFDGKTYTAYKNSVGSRGTETQLFQFLKDSTLILKNGTLDVASDLDSTGNFKMVIQNYSNLTLDNMIVDGRNLLGPATYSYTLSNNNGTVNIKDSKIIAKQGGIAFDVYHWAPNYHDVVVNVENSEIIGRIEVDASARAIGDDRHELNITGGKLIAETTSGKSKITTNGTTTLNNVVLDGNVADSGAAIYNSVKMAGDDIAGRGILNLNNVTLTNNSSTENGGAIYNSGTVNLSGTNTFADNTVNGVKNDIFNSGTMNIVSGSTTISDGVDGNGTLNVQDGAILDIGTSNIVQENINLDGKMIATLRPGEEQITADSITGDGTLSLIMNSKGEYDIFGKTAFVGDITIDSPIYDLDWSDDKKHISVVAKSGESIAMDTGVSQNSANAISAFAQSEDTQINNLALIIQDAIAHGKTEYVEQELAKMNPEKAPVFNSVALSIQHQVLSTAGERMALPLTGRNGGDIRADFGVWARGIYNKTKHRKYFDGETWGGSVGIDTDLNHKVILGAGYAFGDTNVDLHTHDVDIDSNTLFIYGQYRKSDWFVNGTVAYTMSKYKWNKSIFGMLSTPSYKVNALSEQIMGGYHFGNGITPTLGLRHLSLHQNSYQDGLLNVEATDATYLTGVVGADYKYVWIAPYTSVFWTPELRIAAIYDMISDSDTAHVMIPGAIMYTVESESLSRLGAEFGIGLSAEYHYLTVSLNYDLTVRQDYASHTGSLRLKYKF